MNTPALRHPPSLLCADEARSLIERIRSHITDARALVLELYEREGWKALGYESWRECVVTEFEQSKSHLYRLLDAAKVEQNISQVVENQQNDSPNGGKGSALRPLSGLTSPIAERVLRPLTKLDPEQQREAWAAATESSPKPTAELVAKIARKTVEADAAYKHPPRLSAKEQEERRQAEVAQQEREIKASHLFIILSTLALGKESPANTATDLLDYDEETFKATKMPLTKAVWEKAAATLTECYKQWRNK